MCVAPPIVVHWRIQGGAQGARAPPKSFLLGVAIPLTNNIAKHTEFVHAATPSPRQEGDAMPHLLTLGSKFTTCIVGMAWPDCVSARGLAPPSLNFWIRHCCGCMVNGSVAMAAFLVLPISSIA